MVHPVNLTLQDCLGLSDVVISAVPSAEYKVKTDWLKDGSVCLNVAADKNFEKDVRDKVIFATNRSCAASLTGAGIYIYSCCRQGHNFDAAAQFVSDVA